MVTDGFREMTLAVWRGQDPQGVVWQPRLEFWYAVNEKRGTLPDPLQSATLMDVYDYCYASVRYFGNGLRVRHHGLEIDSEWLDDKRLRHTWRTPVGTLTQVTHYDEWQLSNHITEYKLKRPEDFAVQEYILQHEEWYWDQESFEEDLARVGDRGIPQYYFRRSPIQGLMIEHMGLRNTIYALVDYPEIIEHYVQVQTEADDALYEVVCGSPVELVNLGENIDAHIDPPSIWNGHLIPYYRMRTEQLHAAGKQVYIHVDGAMKPLLPHLRACPWDGIEAATPLPQGDVSIEEIGEALGDLILLDGIPALFFLPSFSLADLRNCVERVVELFYPHLILGISDEIPPDGDIERVRQVGEWVRDLV